MMRNWQFATLILLCAIGGLAIRLPGLDVRPMHGDEAVHAVKFAALWETGAYVYDRQEYHGPVLYYATLPSAWLGGAGTFGETREATYRIVPVLFGVGLILLLWPMGDGPGRAAAACAAALTAVSPAMVYYSRYYIQEMLLVFSTFAAIVAGWRYVQSRRTAWALLTGGCLGLMHATKETCVIAFGAMAAALVGTILWDRWTGRPRASVRPYLRVRTVVGAAAVGIGVSVLCFSAFFTNLVGPADSVRALGVYLDRAGGDGIHDHPWHYYLRMLLLTRYSPGPVWSEAMILGLAAVGCIAALTRSGAAGAGMGLLRFLVLYALIMTAVYSAIPYKTPWCMLEFLHPMILLAGVGAVSLVRRLRFRPVRVAACLVLVAGGAHLGRQAFAASFRFYADNRNPYAYAHPLGSVKHLGGWVERLAGVHPDGRRMVVKVIAPNPWPLPWYLRRMERVGYWEGPPADADAPVVIVAQGLWPALEGRLDKAYEISHYGLRPGVMLRAYVDRTLWEAFAASEPRGHDVDDGTDRQ